MKKIIASAGLVALGAAGTQAAVQMGTAAKPWDVELTVRGFNDDNYNMASSGPGKRSSFGVEVKPSVGLGLTGQQTSFGTRYTYDMRYYDDRKNNTADHSHEFNAWVVHAFSERYSVDAAETFTLAQEPLQQDPSFGTVRSNGSSIHNEGDFDFHAQLTRMLELVLGYRNNLYNYNNDSYAALLNRMEHLAKMDFRWQFQPTTIGVLGYQFGLIDYMGHGAGSTYRNNRSQYVYVGLDHNFRKNLTGSVRVGGQYVDFYNTRAGDGVEGKHVTELNPYANVSMRYNYAAGSWFEMGVEHHRNATDGSSLDQETTSVFASLTHAFTPKLTGNLNGQYQNAAFTGGLGTFAGQSDNIYLLGASLEYHFTQHLSADVGYNYDKVDSKITGRSYDRNRVYLGMTASY
jgi:hypothetical protein